MILRTYTLETKTSSTDRVLTNMTRDHINVSSQEYPILVIERVTEDGTVEASHSFQLANVKSWSFLTEDEKGSGESVRPR